MGPEIYFALGLAEVDAVSGPASGEHGLFLAMLFFLFMRTRQAGILDVMSDWPRKDIP